MRSSWPPLGYFGVLYSEGGVGGTLGAPPPKSTLGGSATAFSSSTVNEGLVLKPNTIAVRLLGNERTVTLYSCTALM